MASHYTSLRRQEQRDASQAQPGVAHYPGPHVGWPSQANPGPWRWPGPPSPPYSSGWPSGHVRPAAPWSTAEASVPWAAEQHHPRQLSASTFGYFLDRGDGTVTRLIPADRLPPLNEVPRTERRGPGMEILPHLSGVPPVGTAGIDQAVTVKESVSPLRAQGKPDTARSCPSTKMHHQQHHKAGKQYDKKYCDKWIHEGVCAFTQQGCRYRHEMPFDKATQQSLGLFHGLPNWWKKQQAELHRQQQQQQGGGGGRPAAKRHTLSGPYQLEAAVALIQASTPLSGPVADRAWHRGSWADASQASSSGTDSSLQLWHAGNQRL